MSTGRHYVVPGYFTVTAPGRVCECDIYIEVRGSFITVRGVDLFDKEKRFLGFWYPQNIGIDKRREMIDYCRKHTAKWRDNRNHGPNSPK